MSIMPLKKCASIVVATGCMLEVQECMAHGCLCAWAGCDSCRVAVEWRACWPTSETFCGSPSHKLHTGMALPFTTHNILGS